MATWNLVNADDPALARTAIGVTTFYVASYVAAEGSAAAGIAAAIVAAGAVPAGVVDFGGVSYVTAATVTVGVAGVTLQNGGIVPTGAFTALTVTAADVTVRNMTFSRASTAPVGTDSDARNCVYVNAERFRSFDCDYSGADLAIIYLEGGACNNSEVRGGSITGPRATQNAAGIYVSPSADGNRNLVFEGIHIHDCTDGILAFDTGYSRIEGNRVDTLRRLPEVTLTGWSVFSGNVYRQRTATGSNPGVDGPSDDRADGPTVVLLQGSTIRTQVTGTAPGTNQWSSTSGYVYLNLGGTDPGTVTITSRIVSGYGVTVYSSSVGDVADVSYNVISNNIISDVDGFGVYIQLSNSAGAVGNTVSGNRLESVCLAGRQTTSLPFAGIGVVGGAGTTISNNLIKGVGASGLTVPGVLVWPGSSNATPSGRIVGTIVRNSWGAGFSVESRNWSMVACNAHSSAGSGIAVTTATAGYVLEGVSLVGCTVTDSTSAAIHVDGSAAAVIGNIAVQIIGCNVVDNLHRGIQFSGGSAAVKVSQCSVVGCLIKNNVYQHVLITGFCSDIVVANNALSSTVSGSSGYSAAANVTNCTEYANSYSFAGTAKTLTSPVMSFARRLVAVPAAVGSTGVSGDYAVDNSHVYFCTSNTNWRQITLTTW